MNKQNRDDIIELLYSDSGACVIVSQIETLEDGQPSGRIIRKSKKELKKTYKKTNIKNVKVPPISDDIKQEIVNTFINDRSELLDNTKEYIAKRNLKNRQAYFESISDEEYLNSLEEFKDKDDKKKSIKIAQKNKQNQREMEIE